MVQALSRVGVIALVAIGAVVSVGACGSQEGDAGPVSSDAGADGGVDAAVDGERAAVPDAALDATSDASPDGGVCTSLYTDISAGQGAASGYMPSAVIDAANAKLLVVAANVSVGGASPTLFRCNLDGTGCTYSDISAGQPGYGGARVAVDVANGKLLVVASDFGSNVKPGLFRCNLDGTACTFSDISAGAGNFSGYEPSLVIDAVNAKLLVVTRNDASSGKPHLFRCDLDGTACTHTDISAGQGTGSGYVPSTLIDVVNAKLLVVTNNKANLDRPALFRCNLDGTACTYSDISAGQGTGSGGWPSAVLDAANAKLLVVTQNTASSNKPALFRCNVDGSACTYADISAGQGANSGARASAALDAANAKLLVVTQNNAGLSKPPNPGEQNKPGLFRCNLDGTGCTYSDVASGTGQGSDSGQYPSTVLDVANARLLVVTTNGANAGRPALFTVACSH